MRILISSTANDGHFGPLVPLARAAIATGHELLVAAPASFAGTVAKAGLRHAPFADPPPELIGPVMARLPHLPFDEADATVVREVFARIDAQAAFPAVADAISDWRPDVVLREPAEFGSLAAAVRTGTPHVQVAIGMSEVSRMLVELTRESLAELARLAGLPEDTLTTAQQSAPLLSPVPELLDRAGDEAYEPGAVTFRYRDATPRAPHAQLPAWGDPGHPLVYVTFGSVTGSLPPFAGVFREALDGLSALPVRVLLTVGRRIDITRIGPVPANARVERWWPQDEVLGHAALVLGHGGFGTTMGALTAGVPQVVAPIFTSDQIVNARHVAAIGAGRWATPGTDVVVRACPEVAHVLADPSYRSNARAVAAAVAALPPVSAAIDIVEQLAR